MAGAETSSAAAGEAQIAPHIAAIAPTNRQRQPFQPFMPISAADPTDNVKILRYVLRPGFHPAGGCDLSSRFIVLLPGFTVYCNPEVSLIRYHAGVIAFPGGGGPPLCVCAIVEFSFAVTLT